MLESIGEEMDVVQKKMREREKEKERREEKMLLDVIHVQAIKFGNFVKAKRVEATQEWKKCKE